VKTNRTGAGGDRSGLFCMLGSGSRWFECFERRRAYSQSCRQNTRCQQTRQSADWQGSRGL